MKMEEVIEPGINGGFTCLWGERVYFIAKKINIRHLPIVKSKKLVGINSLHDSLQVEIQDKKVEIKVLHEYIYCIPACSVSEKTGTIK